MDNKIHAPHRRKLQEAVEVFENFREMCEMQFDLGYVFNTQFPSKHHINKILHIEYIPSEELNKLYSEALIKRAMRLIPACKSYILFVRGRNGKAEDTK